MFGRSVSNSMPTIDVFRSRAFLLALAFCFAISVATAAAFGVIYLQVSKAEVQRVGAVLVDEAARERGRQRRRAPSGARTAFDARYPSPRLRGRVRRVRRQDFRRRAGHAADPGRRVRPHCSTADSAQFERLRTRAVRRSSASGRRRRAAWTLAARSLRPAGNHAEGDGDRLGADRSPHSRDRRDFRSPRVETLRAHSQRDPPHHGRRASLAPAGRHGRATTSKRSRARSISCSTRSSVCSTS